VAAGDRNETNLTPGFKPPFDPDADEKLRR